MKTTGSLYSKYLINTGVSFTKSTVSSNCLSMLASVQISYSTDKRPT